MENKHFSEQLKKLFQKLKKNKLIAAALVLGIVLLLLPTGGGSGGTAGTAEQLGEPEFSLSVQEQRIADALTRISGVGKVSVVLTLKSGAEREVITNDENTDSGSKSTTVTAQNGSGKYDAVTRRYMYPQYQGALIVCEGGENASVRLRVAEAVAALTGLGTDRITIAKMEK